MARSMTARSVVAESGSSSSRIWWRVELAEVLEGRPRPRGGGDDDLAAVGRVVVALEQPELDEAVDDAASRSTR